MTGDWPVYVIGQGNVGGQAWAASQLATLQVAEPFATATLARSSCEQGQSAQIACTLTQSVPFEGEGTARLQGLPPNTSSTEVKFTKETKEIVFEVTTNDKSPVGNHKTPFVELVTICNGEPVQANGGKTELQIATPSKRAPAASPAQTAAASPASPTPAPPGKPLSRLEKLRLQGKQGPPK